MAAITGGLEQDDSIEADVEADLAGGAAGAGPIEGFAFGGPAKNVKAPGVAHAALTNAVWARLLLERELKRREYKLLRNSEGWYYFEVTPPITEDTIPWSPLAPQRKGVMSTVHLFSAGNKKMACPSFALPAGGVFLGATCPGADAAHSVTPLPQRKARTTQTADGQTILLNRAPESGEVVPVLEGLTICSRCYATGFSSYTYTDNLYAGLVRHWWLRDTLKSNPGLVVDVLTDAVLHLEYPDDRHGIKPLRLHDSGDFFDPEYAQAWVDVANRLATEDPKIVIWARNPKEQRRLQRTPRPVHSTALRTWREPNYDGA